MPRDARREVEMLGHNVPSSVHYGTNLTANETSEVQCTRPLYNCKKELLFCQPHHLLSQAQCTFTPATIFD